MITLHLSPADVEKVRFAYSPMIEISASFRLLNYAPTLPTYRAWVEETQRRLEGHQLPFMAATILPKQYIVDFMTPTPTKPTSSFADEIERLRATPDAQIRRNIERVILMGGSDPLQQVFLERPREALECLIDELRFYWQQALEPYWTQLATILEGDVLFRARRLATHGIDAMFSDLSAKVDYHQGVLSIDKTVSDHLSASHKLDGSGIQLVPSVFMPCGGTWQVEPEYLPMLIYEVRGLGLWTQKSNDAPDAALEITLGKSRARLLMALVEPAHTNDLAYRLGLTAGAVSQQLGKLTQAGLIESFRSGNKVYYQLSTRGEQLLNVFAG